MYLKAWGLSAIGLSFFQVALGTQWALLILGWTQQSKLELALDLKDFTQAVAACLVPLISFGALAGKVSPLQTLVMTLVEILFYALNKVYFMTSYLEVHDNYCMTICVFASYFGLAASLVYGPAHEMVAMHGATTSYHMELLAFLGNLILWVNWPGFIGTNLPMGSAPQRVAMMNAVLALLGSSVVAFALTTMPTKRLYTSLGLASLAGGVAISAVADFKVRPGGAVLIGAVAAGLSCLCFKGLFGNTVAFDTFNIAAVFGVPGVFGGLVSVIAPSVIPDCWLIWHRQLEGLVGTIVFACATGAGTGALLVKIAPPIVAFTDECYWEAPEDAPTVEEHTTLASVFSHH